MKKLTLFVLVLLITVSSFGLDNNYYNSNKNLSTTNAERLLISKALYEQGYDRDRIDNLVSKMNEEQVLLTFENIDDIKTGKMTAIELEVWIVFAIILIVVGYLGKDK